MNDIHLSEREIYSGTIIIKCPCCGFTYKTSGLAGVSQEYGAFGCYLCKGVEREAPILEPDQFKADLSDIVDGDEFAGIASRLKQPQRILNTISTDISLSLKARPEFELWFDSNMEFSFFMSWSKPIAKKFCWWGYFAGYKNAHDYKRGE